MHVRPGLALLAVASALPFAILATACGGKAAVSASTADTSQQPVQPQPNYNPQPTAPPPTAAPAPTGGTGAATPILPMAAAAVGPLLTQMGQSEAPGAQPDGSPFAGQFAAGQTLEQTINIKGNGCYTVVGASIGIQQLDIQLMITPPPPLPPFAAMQSQGGGPNAVLGGKAQGCWRNPTPLAGQGKVILRATSGQGLAAAQVFSK